MFRELFKAIQEDRMLQCYIRLFVESYDKNNYDEYCRYSNCIDQILAEDHNIILNYDFNDYKELNKFITREV